MSFFTTVIRNWFLFGILFSICFARFNPSLGAKGGILKPEVTVKYIGVFIIFFNSGISLKTEQLTRAVFQVNIHLFVQCFTFIIFPMLIHLLVWVLKSSPLDTQLLEGLTVLSCMPPPVSSAVILTKSTGGNEAAAIFNSAFGSFLGIIITPALVLVSVGSTAAVPVSTIFGQLSSTVVLPLLLGQIIRCIFKNNIERKRIPFGAMGSFILLFIIYTTFCDTFSHNEIQIDEMSLFSIILLLVVLQLGLMLVVYSASSLTCLNLQPSDTVALLFCCTHKSLTLGIPIIKIIFGGSEGMITIPLLVYHPTQILLGGLLVPSIRGWLIATERFRFMYPSKKRFAQFQQV